MTYQISITGHGATSDDAIEAFDNLVRALRKVNDEGVKDPAPGWSNTPYLSGSLSGSGIDGVSISRTTEQVEDTSQYETDEVEEEDDTEEDDEVNPEDG